MFVIGAVGLITLVLFIWIYRKRRFDQGVVRGRRVLITGASSGIGAELAYQYAKLGASVFITARTEELLIQVVEKCASVGNETAKHGYCVCDMSQYKTETKRIIEETVKFLGGLDTLIINHANIGYISVWHGTQTNLDLFDDMVNVNFTSYVHLASHALPYLTQSKQGRMAVTGSVAGKMSWPTIIPYCGCKFALDGFFGGWNLELLQAKDKLSITLILPGFVATNTVTTRLQEGVAGFLSTGPHLARMANTQFGDVEVMAYETMRATETGQREFYYPFLYRSAYFTMPAWTIPLLRHFIPSLLPPIVWKPGLYAEKKKAAGLTL